MMDFTGMKPSDALAKAHKAFPTVRWSWADGHTNKVGGCCCAAGLLTLALLGPGCTGVMVLNKVFPSIVTDLGIYGGAWHHISVATRSARSFPEAIELLREKGL